MKKTIYTLNVDHYSPEITSITYPYIEYYANKIGANSVVIDQRKYPEYPVIYEKLQIYELSQDNDWNIFVDSDAMIHHDTPDFTQIIPKDTVFHVGCDFAAIRFRYDKYFERDGRNFGSCNWFTMASNLCTDLWKPLDDISKEEAISNIFPVNDEILVGITPDHLLDDYVLSRNIAKYGLKTMVYRQAAEKYGIPGDYFWHEYLMSTKEKIENLNHIKQYWLLDEKGRKAYGSNN